MNIFGRLSLYKHKNSAKAVLVAKINGLTDKRCISDNLADTQPLDYHQILNGDMLMFCSTGFRIISEIVFLNLYKPYTEEEQPNEESTHC